MATIQHRRGTATEWTTANRVLASGEIGVETDTRKFKIGDGVTAWTDLQYGAGESAGGGSGGPVGIGDVTGLADALAAKVDDTDLAGFAPAVHAHTIDQVAGLQAALTAAGGTVAGSLPVLNIDTAGVPVLDKETWVPTTYTLYGQVIPGDIRGRGNSTWAQPKKPWNMRLTNPTSLLGMTGAKRWSLLANYVDTSQLRNAIAMHIGALMTGLEWTPRCQFVEVVRNGIYEGVYQLFEPVRMETGRVAYTSATGGSGLPLTGAYLLEIDNYAPTEPGTHWFSTTHDSLPIKLDTPDGTDVTNGAAQVAYISNWVNQFETVLYGPDWLDPTAGYARFIDRDSFIDWYLVNELLAGNDSGFATSCKLYKTRDTATDPGKLFLGPLWDYDLSLGAYGYSPTGWWVRGTTTPIGGSAAPGATWIVRMLSDPDFFAALLARWGQMLTLLAGVPAFIDQTARLIATARNHDSVVWDGSQAGRVAGPWRVAVKEIQDWLAARIAWIDTNLPGSSGGADVTAPTAPTGLAASAITTTGFTVSWSASTDAVGVTGYQVRLDGGAAVDKTGLSHTFSGLAADTTYSVQARARDAAGNFSAWSTGLSVDTAAEGALPAAVAAWGFAESSGTTAADSSGNGHTLTVTAGMLGNAGHTGNGLRQVGTNKVTIDASWITGGERAIMFWARKTATNVGFVRGPVLQDGAANSLFGVMLETFAPEIQFRAYSSGGNNLVATAVTPINEWHHYAAVVRAGALYAYLDGVQVGSPVTVTGTLSAHTVLTIFDGENAGVDVDDVRVFNVGLTEAEVGAFMITPV